MTTLQKIREEVERLKEDRYTDVGGMVLMELLSFLDTTQEEEKKEEIERRRQYRESFFSYWDCILKKIDRKRVLPIFKGKTLHDFKNELHTMKQIISLINHPEIHEGLFDKLAMVFAVWGGYHLNLKETKPEDTLQEPEVDLEKYYPEFLQKEWFGKSKVRTVSEMMEFTAKHFYELGKQSSDKDCLKIKGWVARDKDGTLTFGKNKPRRNVTMWLGFNKFAVIPFDMFSDLKWEDEPREVELTIKKV